MPNIKRNNYYSASDSDIAWANSVKRKFLKIYPDAKVSISRYEKDYCCGTVKVNGKYAFGIGGSIGAAQCDHNTAIVLMEQLMTINKREQIAV